MGELDKCLDEVIELEGGVGDSVEYFEELRLLLGSFLKPGVLDELLSLYGVLNQEPKNTEMYAWFARNSQVGKDCKFARAALKRFKEDRLDKLEPLLESCLQAVKSLRD